ncbi:hypothetical protein [Fodinibius sp. SL11]|uniref:hypothetical protein n=1 Tax=Fodinibius sp. SL11 TaxID=3425690 RepID=UPI003F885867
MQEKYLFRYTGDQSTIDLNTLLVTQFHYLGVLNEISRKVLPNNEIKITVNAFHKKSFGIEQVIELVAVGSIAFKPEINNLELFFELLQDYLKIKDLLGAEKAENVNKAENKLEIKGNNNTIYVAPEAFQIYQENSVVDEALRKSGEALDSDEEIDGIEVTKIDQKDKPLIQLDRDSFKQLSKSNGYLKEKNEKTELEKDQVLYVKKFDTDPTKRTPFTFIYRERKIKRVKIVDEDFLEKVSSGLRFGNGDALLVDLEITKEKDKAADVFVEKGYKIIEVKDVRRRGDTGDLFMN